MELDHMVPRKDRGFSTIDNAIPLCFECHAEAHFYNDSPPRGRKFRPNELKPHKQQWLSFCAANPGALAQLPNEASVGPLHALLDELDFNIAVAEDGPRKTSQNTVVPCHFMTDLFRRALQLGALSILEPDISAKVNAAYVEIGRANHLFETARTQHPMRDAYSYAVNEASQMVPGIGVKLRHARNALTDLLGRDQVRGAATRG